MGESTSPVYTVKTGCSIGKPGESETSPPGAELGDHVKVVRAVSARVAQ